MTFDDFDYLESILNHLPKCERKILELYYIQGYTQAEVGKKYNLSGGAIFQYLKRLLMTCYSIASKLDKGIPVIIEPTFGHKSRLYEGKGSETQVKIKKSIKSHARRDRSEFNRKLAARLAKQRFDKWGYGSGSIRDGKHRNGGGYINGIYRRSLKGWKVVELRDKEGYRYAAWMNPQGEVEHAERRRLP
jgi:predicted DNA-binding protein YlxM (UPF0122 family)